MGRRRRRTSFARKIFSVAPGNIIAYWPINENSGTTFYDRSGNGRNGTIVGSPSLVSQGVARNKTGIFLGGDGSGDWLNAYSTSFRGAWNGNEFTIDFWVRVDVVGGEDPWTCAHEHNFFRFDVGDGQNLVDCRISREGVAADYLLFANRKGGNVAKKNTVSDIRTVLGSANIYLPFHFAMVCSDSGDYQRFYLMGEKQGSDLTGIGTWSGNIHTNRCLIGAALSNQEFHGAIAHFTVRDTPLTDAQVWTLARR